MKFGITGIALAAAVLLAGCQTAPLGDPTLSSELKKFTPNPSIGQVYVCRDGRMMGAAVTPTIELNGRPLVDLGRGTYYYIELPPGDHTIIAKSFEHDST